MFNRKNFLLKYGINLHVMQLMEQFSLCRIYRRSKCTRAFDRRPAPTAASTHDQAEVWNFHHCHSNEGVITVDDNQHNPAVESEINWDMATENELLLDSEVVELLGLTYENW